MSSPSRRPRLRTKSPESSTVFSEAKLVRAIQTLDSTWKRTTEEKTDASPLSDLLREALCTLLEIAACFDTPDLVQMSQLETVCTARVLGCLKRFVAGMQPSLGECCDCKCEQRLIHLTLLSILFRMCREPEVAGYVVREDLHKFLLKMSMIHNSDLTSGMNPKQDDEIHQDDVAFDPHDLMITIDPFDWCYQPLCSRLFKENNHAVFIPMGIRPLVCLLRGIGLPTDEVSEFEQRIHVSGGAHKRRKLPSIFAFPLHEDTKEVHVSTKTSQYKLPTLCCKEISTRNEQREIRALWGSVLSDNSKIHLALRSLIALDINIPRPSQEYRSIMHEGDFIRRSLRKYRCWTLSCHKLENALSWLNSGSDSIRVDLLPFQTIATQKFILTRIASTALSLFAEEESTNVIVAPKERITTSGRTKLRPISKKSDFTRNFDPLSIDRRLHAASKAAHFELARSENRRRGSELERNRQRLAIRKACADVESLRNHLISSLEILCFGRQHPDPQQPFSEWIKSLPTLESLQLERQYQQEMRQRQILEQQYQRETQRRRERNECILMQGNDYNVPEENELSIRQQKHQQFLCMQAEIRALEQRDSNEEKNICRTEASTREPTIKETRVIQERLRLLQLDDQRREGRELEKMCREDLYYVERILRAKANAKEEQEKRERSGDLQKNVIQEQQRHIARMRLLDEEKRLAERESSGMRLEDLFGRQIRLREAEKAKEELNHDWRERKTMQAEEHDCRSRWTLWERALIKQQQEELKILRVEERRRKRQQQREEREIRVAWVENWDIGGNKYYYNSITGISQWEVPDQF
ncbi:hypothetical protein PC128_g7144 [Phytophthora cactorum]|nr:hypothetical protein PC128_g7144 [Phytophthora cactorum]